MVEYEFTCESCGVQRKEHFVPNTTYSDAAKSIDWEQVNADDEFIYICPQCIENEDKELERMEFYHG